MNNLKSRYALVTGGSSGIGRSACIKLAEQGFNVIINYNSNLEGATLTKELVEKHNVKAYLLPFDVSKSENVKKTLDNWIKENPDRFIEVLINNAGYRNDNLMVFMTEEQWLKVINTNLNSFFYVTKPLLRSMILRKKGVIINVSSMSGVKGWQGQVHYAASKAGLIGASKSLSKEVGSKNIRVNVIAPGFVKTKMTTDINEEIYKSTVSLDRFAEEEEIGNVIAFLASDQSSYINGQVIEINGGEYNKL
jgi:3-oxoacyl-[acyl-carrier protein] reductase